MREASNIMDLIALKPDYIGFIFYKKSLRCIENRPSVDIPKGIKKVGVFVNESERVINEKRIKFGLDILQLHGDESPELCYLLKQGGAQIIKVFRIDEAFDFGICRRYENYVDYFLFDTACKDYGGSGQKFNWELLEKYNNARPVFLSGGISPNDVDLLSKVEGVDVMAIDINSKFEVKPGVKNIKLLHDFFVQFRTESQKKHIK